MNYAIKLSEDNFLEEKFESNNTIDLKHFSVQCWLKTVESGPLFLHNTQEGDTRFSISVSSDGKVNFNVRSTNFNKGITSVRGGINNGEWSYLSAIKNGDELSIIINGQTVSTTQTDTTPLSNEFIDGILIGKNIEDGNNHQFFNGELGGISIWNRALSTDEIIKYYQEPVKENEEGLILNHPFEIKEDQQNNLLKQKGAYIPQPLQTVEINIFNSSPHEFILAKQTGNQYSEDWPKSIPPSNPNNPTPPVILKGSMPYINATAIYTVTNNEYTKLTIEVHKSETFYESFVKTTISDDLEREISVINNDEQELDVDLRISENLVIVNALNLNKFLNKVIPKIGANKIVTSMDYNEKTGVANSSAQQIVKYNQACQLFNRRINKKPLAIVYCTNVSDVETTYAAAIEFNLPIRVRTGGHDHEGESSGTNTILIDLIGLNTIVTGKAINETGQSVDISVIGAGNRFQTLTTDLARKDVMLPHGTCATVAIPGFTMGGGWGPYTRKQGMCCEHLIGAEIVLGNGKREVISTETLKHSFWMEGTRVISIKKNKPELAWALKGGGGMSYGIVTAFIFQTFKLPTTLVKFEVIWNKYDDELRNGEEQTLINTLKILTQWEDAIKPLNTPSLTGTNLKINGKPLKIIGYTDNDLSKPIYEDFDENTVVHNCVMYGYWEGKGNHKETEEEVQRFVKKQFTDQGALPTEVKLDGIGGLGKDYNPRLESWDRESHSNILLMASSNGKESNPYPPDLDEPAPHKITSRLVDNQGLGDQGHKALLSSLTSKLILEGNRKEGLFTYVTLGAISGEYYEKVREGDLPDESAFPYKDKQYIIQYQTWWNLELAQKEELQDNKVYTRTNRALDWMEVSRDFLIPNTSGAFISFKDSSIPTKTYFAQNYDQLKNIKETFSLDPDNHFRTRKTII